MIARCIVYDLAFIVSPLETASRITGVTPVAENQNLTGERRSYLLSRLINDIVYDSVFLSLLRIHDEIALYIFFHFIQFLSAVFCQ